MKKLFLFLLACCAPAFGMQMWPFPGGRVPTAQPSNCGSGYAHYRTYTVNNVIISGPHANLPVIFAPQAQGGASQASFKTVANGGSVESASGYDIIVCTAASGGTQIAHELVSYSPTTGALEMYFNPGGVNNGSVYYIFYGKSGATDTSNACAVWVNYVLVMHMEDTGWKDSSCTAATVTNHGVTTASGALGNAAYIGASGNSNYLDLPHSSAYDFGTGNFTVSYYLNLSALTANTVPISTDTYSSGWQGWHNEVYGGAGTYMDFVVRAADVTGATSMATGSWKYIANMRTSGSIKSGVGNTANGTISWGSDVAATGNVTTTNHLMIGRNPDTTYPRNMAGYIDEVRVSNVSRSNEYMGAEWGAMGALTFYTLGSEQ